MGMISANAYLLIDEQSKDAAIIDVGGDFSIVKDELASYDANLKFILNTHGHFDHILGECEMQKEFDIPVYIHKDDENLLKNLPKQLEMFGFVSNALPAENVKTFDDGDVFKLGEIEIKVIHTPGHTPGSVCFLVEDNFAGGSFQQISDSILNKLFNLDESINVYPGHDSKTTIGYEKKYNCYFGSERM